MNSMFQTTGSTWEETQKHAIKLNSERPKTSKVDRDLHTPFIFIAESHTLQFTYHMQGHNLSPNQLLISHFTRVQISHRWGF